MERSKALMHIRTWTTSHINHSCGNVEGAAISKALPLMVVAMESIEKADDSVKNTVRDFVTLCAESHKEHRLFDAAWEKRHDHEVKQVLEMVGVKSVSAKKEKSDKS